MNATFRRRNPFQTDSGLPGSFGCSVPAALARFQQGGRPCSSLAAKTLRLSATAWLGHRCSAVPWTGRPLKNLQSDGLWKDRPVGKTTQKGLKTAAATATKPNSNLQNLFLSATLKDGRSWLRLVVVDRGMDGGEFLQGLDVPEPGHRPFPPSKRLVRVLGPVVKPASAFLPSRISERLHRSRIGSKPVGNDWPRPAIALHRALQKLQRCPAIPPFCGKNLKYLPFMVDCAP